MSSELESGAVQEASQFNGDFEVPVDTRIITDTGHSWSEIESGAESEYVEVQDDEWAAKQQQQSGYKADINDAPVENAGPATEDFPADGGDDAGHVTRAKVITKEDVKGEDPKAADAEQEEVLPDRALIAPELAQFLKEQEEPAPNPLEERLARIEQALTASEEAEAEGPQGLEGKLELLLQRIEAAEAREAERVEQEAHDARMRAYREGIMEKVRRESDKFPGLVKLGYEENVYQTLVNELKAGRVASEDEIASKAEAELRTLYTTLKEVYEPTATTSKVPQKQSKPKSQPKTLTQNLSSADTTADIGELIAKHGPQVAAEIVWNRKNRNV